MKEGVLLTIVVTVCAFTVPLGVYAWYRAAFGRWPWDRKPGNGDG